MAPRARPAATRKGRKRRPARPAADPYEINVFDSYWLSLTPHARLARSWRLRALIPDLYALHDAKLFPKP